MSDFTVSDEEWRNNFLLSILRNANNLTPHEEIEKMVIHIENTTDQLLVMGLLNDFKFLIKAIQDELGEERAKDIYKSYEQLKIKATKIPSEQYKVISKGGEFS